MSNRASQFLPFDGLVGFKEEIKKQEITKKEKKELSDDQKEYLSFILNNLEKEMLVEITYYKIAKYKSLKGKVERIDYIERIIYINDEKINFDDIYDITTNNIKFYKDEMYSC